ncbi:MAG: tRNA (cytidine(34)-2'-O)-methyltransferase [Deltaproteobacteria bacterium]|nr:tRNA (cytidine(34)-2'-O)-methyltransferase [Deltaproteobacteria bacterium]
MFHIALIHPDIPQNTGNISRLCVGLDIELHLVYPMRFVLDDKKIKRAGLDYWKDLKLVTHDSLAAFLLCHQQSRMFFFTTKAKQLYTNVTYQKGDFLVFGSESRGLPTDLLHQNWEHAVTIPMPGKVRSLNVSNAAAVAAYEVMRQFSLSPQ